MTNEIEILEITEAGEDGGDLMGWYAKGHHNKKHFTENVKKYSGFNSYSDFKTCKENFVKHIWWRCVPMRWQDGCTMFVDAKEGDRGAFPATVFEFAGKWHSDFREEQKLRQEGREQGQREAANFAFHWILATKGEKSAEEFLNSWNERKV